MSTETPFAGAPSGRARRDGPAGAGASGGPDGPSREPDGPPPRTSSESGRTPWVETRAGNLFFVNAVLVAPIFMALYPWTIRWILRSLDVLNRPSRVLDPVPAVADYFIPVLGWVTIPAAWLVWKNLRIAERPWARRALWVFLAAHLGTLGYTLLRVFG